MHISIAQAIKVYDELYSAMEGKANFGSDTAEIYAYTLMPYKPSFTQEMTSEMCIAAAASLISVIDMFMALHPNAICKINDMDYLDWGKGVGDKFSHRCHVFVTAKKEAK